MDTQQLFPTFLLLLCGLFLQELARRTTQRLSHLSDEKHTVTYFDFVKRTLHFPFFQKDELLNHVLSIIFLLLSTPLFMSGGS